MMYFGRNRKIVVLTAKSLRITGMEVLKKILFPILLVLFGIGSIITGISTNQNGAFMFGAFSLLIAGAISLVSSMVMMNKTIRLITSAGLLILVASLAYANFMSIKVPIDFKNEKERRYTHVIQRLKDIRTAELAFKSKYQKYTGSFDTLSLFLETGKFSVIKALGEVPDTMTIEDAIKAGIAKRDTIYVPVFDSLFGPRHAADRDHPFNLDSLAYVPFEKEAKFTLESGFVERSGVKVPVFQATDSKPFDAKDVKQVGSMSDPKTNGNWE